MSRGQRAMQRLWVEARTRWTYYLLLGLFLAVAQILARTLNRHEHGLAAVGIVVACYLAAGVGASAGESLIERLRSRTAHVS